MGISREYSWFINLNDLNDGELNLSRELKKNAGKMGWNGNITGYVLRISLKQKSEYKSTKGGKIWCVEIFVLWSDLEMMGMSSEHGNITGLLIGDICNNEEVSNKNGGITRWNWDILVTSTSWCPGK